MLTAACSSEDFGREAGALMAPVTDNLSYQVC
jgi:hypothetical protein